MMLSKEFHRSSGRGFTMIEFIVVLALFATLLGTTVGIFISTLQQQRRVLGDQELFNQASFMMEYLSRSLRTAVIDEIGNCIQDEGGGAGYAYIATRYDSASGFYQGVKFLADDGNCIEMFLDESGSLQEIRNAEAPQLMLSSKFDISYARFVINGDKDLIGAHQNDTLQPRITVVFSARSQATGDQPARIFQTTISQANLND